LTAQFRLIYVYSYSYWHTKFCKLSCNIVMIMLNCCTVCILSAILQEFPQDIHSKTRSSSRCLFSLLFLPACSVFFSMFAYNMIIYFIHTDLDRLMYSLSHMHEASRISVFIGTLIQFGFIYIVPNHNISRHFKDTIQFIVVTLLLVEY